MIPAVELKKVSKFFGSNEVLKGISLELWPGRFYVLLGKNGAGKSTLMRILMRYEVPDSGEGLIFGTPIESDTDERNLSIGYVSESLEFALPLKMNKLFSYYREIYPNWDQKIFEGVLGELGISLNRYFKELSRGQKMQVAFAAAIAIRPKILLLDEITAVLDANARAFFMDYLGRFTRDGGTVVMATNIVSEVQNFANHVIMLHEGKVSLDLPFVELSKKFLKIRKSPGARNPIFEDPGCIEVCTNSDGSVSYVISKEAAEKYEIPADFHDKRNTTAEEIFIYFTRSKEK